MNKATIWDKFHSSLNGDNAMLKIKTIVANKNPKKLYAHKVGTSFIVSTFDTMVLNEEKVDDSKVQSKLLDSSLVFDELVQVDIDVEDLRKDRKAQKEKKMHLL